MASPLPENAKLRHGCIVMASGVGARFGGNKLIEKVGGATLVEHVLRATDGLFARRVVVTRHAEVAELCRTAGAEVVLHDEPLRSDTVRLGMEVMEGCDTVMFAQADQPLIRACSIAGLLHASEGDPESIWRTRFHGTQGAPVLFPAWAHSELRALPAGKGGGFVARAHEERVRFVDVASQWELFDVDTPNDLRILRAHLGE